MSAVLVLQLAVTAVATTLAAIAAERSLRELSLPGRFAWAASMALTAAFAVLLSTGGSLPLAGPALLSIDAPATVWTAAPEAPGGGVPPAIVAWLAVSAVFASLLAAGSIRNVRVLRRGSARRIRGVSVVVTDAIGPAVLGWVRPRIVVPEWLTQRNEQEQQMVVRHEAEHVAARDPLLAGAAVLLVCALPWHPLLWYQLRRLRLAIELDCDARVLRRTDARAYSRLLVDVAERVARGTPFATALAFPRTFLERRVRMITHRAHRPGRALVWGLATFALLVAACADTSDPVASEQSTAPQQARTPAHALEPAGTMSTALEAAQGGPQDGVSRLVPFQAEPGPDGRPVTIRFEPGTPDDLQAEANGTLTLRQFRRADGENTAPVEGIVTVP